MDTAVLDSKDKTPIICPSADAEAASESGDTFEDVGFLEDSHALLEKIKATAENVTTCQVCVLPSSKRRASETQPTRLGTEPCSNIIRDNTDLLPRTRLRSCSTALVS